MAPPSFQSRGRHKDLSDYNSFYNIKKTKLSARCPFLPKKQIERKIKHLWERASVEKRAIMCLTSSSTTAKSPFKGSILQGLRRKKDSLDRQTISNGGRDINISPEPVRTLRSSIKDTHSPTCRQQTLRSSAKKHVTSRRVSFNLGQSPPSRPNTRNSSLQQERTAETMAIEKSVTAKSASPSYLKKRKLPLESPGHLKKRELSLEEKKLYEFEDEDAGSRMTRLKTEAQEHVFEPEEYNLESTLNSKIFKGESQSPMNSPEQRFSKSPGLEGGRMDKSAEKLDQKTVTRKNTKSTRNSKVNHLRDKDVKKRTKPTGRGRREESPLPKSAIDTTSQSEDTGDVPWMVSAHPDSSSDEVQDDSNNDNEEQEAVYEYYRKSSGESSASTSPSSPQESEDILSSQVESDTRFSWNGVCFTRNSASLPTEAFDSQLSQVSMDAVEVMSVSTEAGMSCDSPLSEFGLPGIPKTSSPHWSLYPTEDNKESVVPQKRSMYLQDKMTMESPISSRRYGLDTEGPRRLAEIAPTRWNDPDAMQEPTTIISPASRKRKMRGRSGEDLVTMTTSIENSYHVSPQGLVKPPRVQNVRHAPMMTLSPASRKSKMRGQRGEDFVSTTTTGKTIKNNNKAKESARKPVAVPESSFVRSCQRNVLAETNSRPANPVLKTTNKTKREKEDCEPGVKTRRFRRMRKKESFMMDESQTEESDDGPHMIDAQMASQLNHTAEHLPNGHTKRVITSNNNDMLKSWSHISLKAGGKKYSKMNDSDEAIKSEGILCDLFQPNISSDKRSFNPPSETEFYQSCMDAVSSHLFLEENFFL